MPRALEVTLAVMAWILINTLPALAIAWCVWGMLKDAFEEENKRK